jgi:hypothetical protein
VRKAMDRIKMKNHKKRGVESASDVVERDTSLDYVIKNK